MKTLKESILDKDFDINLEAVREIPMSSLADALEGHGHKQLRDKQLLKKILQKIGAESYLDMIWNVLQDCEMDHASTSKLTNYEKRVIEYLAKQNPVDPKIVMDVARFKLYDCLYKEADVNGYRTSCEIEMYANERVQVFLHPIYNREHYENLLEFYFFIENGEAGWISIKKGAKKENIDLLRYILR